MHHADPMASAIDRVSEVSVGAVTGLLVSFLVLPSRAVRQIRASAAKLLELIAAAFAELLAGLTRGRDNDALHRIQDGIGTAMVGHECDRRRSRTRALGAIVGRAGHRSAVANDLAAAP